MCRWCRNRRQEGRQPETRSTTLPRQACFPHKHHLLALTAAGWWERPTGSPLLLLRRARTLLLALARLALSKEA